MKSATKRKKVAVVTGGSAGIGAAIVLQLLRDGWAVVNLDRSRPKEVIASKLRRNLETVQGDTGDRRSHELARKRADRLGTLMAWVNNAGIERPTRAHDFTEADFEALLRVNLHGYLFGCSEACRSFMANTESGAIVNVSSIRSIVSFPSGYIYETTKGGVDALTRQVAVEYGHLGIRCNAVRPGCIMTPMTRAEVDVAADKPAFLKELGNLHPLERRIGDPREVASVVSFLLSEGSSFVSGQCIAVDGGATARCYPYTPDPGIAFNTKRSRD